MLAIWVWLFYNLIVCPGCGLLFLLQKMRENNGGREYRGSRIKHMGGVTMASDKRIKVTMACTECKQRNYNTMKNKKNDPDRLEMSKYCRFCKKHTSHKETK